MDWKPPEGAEPVEGTKSSEASTGWTPPEGAVPVTEKKSLDQTTSEGLETGSEVSPSGGEGLLEYLQDPPESASRYKEGDDIEPVVQDANPRSSTIPSLSAIQSQAERSLDIDFALGEQERAEVSRIKSTYIADETDLTQKIDSLSGNLSQMQDQLSFLKRTHRSSYPEAQALREGINKTQHEIDAARVAEISQNPRESIDRYGEFFDRYERLPQTHKDALRSRKNEFEKEARSIIDEEVDDLSKYQGGSLIGFGVNAEKAMTKAQDIADKYGGGQRFKQLAYEKIKTDAETEFYAEKVNKTIEDNPEFNEFQKKIGSRLTDDFAETSKSIVQRDSAITELEKELYETLGGEAERLQSSFNEDVQSARQELETRVADGRISPEIADKEFQNIQSKILDGYLERQTTLSNKLQTEYQRRAELISEKYADKIQDEWSKFDKDLTPEESAKLKNLYAETYSKVRGDENKLLNNIDEYLPSQATFIRGYLSSLGRSIAATSTFTGLDAGVVLGDQMAAAFKVGTNPMKEWKDLFDMDKMVKSSANLAGSMTSSIIATSAAAGATGGLGTVPALIASGLAGWASETVDMTGEMYRNTLAETGSESEASEAASQMVDAQVSNMAFYSFEGLPFVSKALRGIRNIPARMAVGGGFETGTEFIQEFRQGSQERAISEQGDWTKFGELMTADAAKETFLNIAPTFLMGAGGQVRSAISDVQRKQEAQRIATKIAAAEVSPNMLDQFLYQLTVKEGDRFAKAVVSSWANMGYVSKEDVPGVMGIIDTVNQTEKNSKAFQLNDRNAFTYFSLMTEYNTLKQEAEALEGDDIMRDKLNQRANEAKKSASEFLDDPNTGGKFVRITMGDDTYIFNEAEAAMVINENIDAIVDGAVNVEGRNIDTNAMIEAARPKPINQTKTMQDDLEVGGTVEMDTGIPAEVQGTPIGERLNKRGRFFDPVLEQEVEGDVYLDGQTVVFESDGRITEIGNVNELAQSETIPISEATPTVTLNESGGMVYQGQNPKIPQGTEIQPQQSGLKSIKRDKDGNLKRVVVTDGQGNTYNLSGQEAIDVAYEMMMSESNKPAFELKIKEDESIQEEIETELVRKDQAVAEGETTQDSQAGLQQGDGRGVNINEKTEEDVQEEVQRDDVSRDSGDDDFRGTREETEEAIEGVERERKRLGINRQKVPVKSVRIEPTIFQFKEADDAESGTNAAERLEGDFDEDLAGSIAVWVDENNEVGNGAGEIYVVDGHHRMELAQRSGIDEINVYYIQAETAKKARLKAAMANISQGRGTAIDAAKVYRDASPEEMVGFVPKSKVGRDGLALSKLSDSIFNAVVQGNMPVNRGVIIGENISNVETQEQFYQEKLTAVRKDLRAALNREGTAKSRAEAIESARKGLAEAVKELPKGIKVPARFLKKAAEAKTDKQIEKIIEGLEFYVEKQIRFSKVKQIREQAKKVSKKLRQSSTYANKEGRVTELLGLDFSKQSMATLDEVLDVMNQLLTRPVAQVRSADIQSLIDKIDRTNEKTESPANPEEIQRKLDVVFDESKTFRSRQAALTRALNILNASKPEISDARYQETLEKIEEAQTYLNEQAEQAAVEMNAESEQMLNKVDDSDMNQFQKEQVKELKRAARMSRETGDNKNYNKAVRLQDIATELAYGYAPMQKMQEYITSLESEAISTEGAKRMNNRAGKKKTIKKSRILTWILPDEVKRKGIDRRDLARAVRQLKLENWQFFDDYFGTGKSEWLYVNIIAPFFSNPIVKSYNDSMKDYADGYMKIVDVGWTAIKPSAKKKMLMAMMQGNWNVSKDGSDYWGQLLQDEKFQKLAKKDHEEIQKLYGELPKETVEVDGEQVTRVDADGYLNSLSGREKKLYAWLVENNKKYSERQRTANERGGQKYVEEDPRYYFPLFRQDFDFTNDGINDFVDQIVASADGSNAKMKSDRGVARTSGKVTAISLDMDNLVREQIFSTNRDLHLSEAVKTGLKTVGKLRNKLTDEDAFKYATALHEALKSRIKTEYEQRRSFFGNLTAGFYARTLISIHRMAVEPIAETVRTTSAMPYGQIAKSLQFRATSFTNEGARKLMDKTGSSFLQDIYLESLAERDRTNLRAGKRAVRKTTGVIKKVAGKLQSFPDRMTNNMSWLPSFMLEFERQAGNGFNVREFNNDPDAYIEQHSEAINKASAFADARTEKLKGAKTRAGQRELIRVAPDFMAGGKGAIKAGTDIAKLVMVLQNFAFLEQYNVVRNGVREMIYGENKDRYLAAREAAGGLISGALYTWGTAYIWASLAGDDDELEKLMSFEGVAESAKSNAAFLAGGRYGQGSKIAVLALTGIYSQRLKKLGTKEAKAELEELSGWTRSRYFSQPFDFGGYKSEADLYKQIMPMVNYLYKDLQSTVGNSTDLWVIMDKKLEGKELSPEENETLVMVALINDLQRMMLLMSGTQLPLQKKLDEYIREEKKKLKETPGTTKSTSARRSDPVRRVNE